LYVSAAGSNTDTDTFTGPASSLCVAAAPAPAVSRFGRPVFRFSAQAGAASPRPGAKSRLQLAH
jgi:hypothetical protein